VHGDIEPRNVVRVHGGGFRLIDFSESRKHLCKESKVQYVIAFFLIAADIGVSSRRSSRKAEVFRTADIAEFVVETAAPSNPRWKSGVRGLVIG
jgi:hypothetical protein